MPRRDATAEQASADSSAAVARAASVPPRFMSVRQVAEYLNLNDKTVYALVNEGRIPGTKVTGKWIFPRELIDRWLLESSHGGAMTDRLLISGSDDPLIARAVTQFTQELRGRAMIGYTPTGTRIGLELLNSGRVDASCLHWGPANESAVRHPALLRQHAQHGRWLLVHAFRREQGLMLAPELAAHGAVTERGDDLHALLETGSTLLRRALRWAMRPEGSGSDRFMREILARSRDARPRTDASAVAGSEREAAAMIAMGEADLAPGARAAAGEFGLGFVSFGWEAFDIALRRDIYFRHLFQDLMARLLGPDSRRRAERLAGYDFTDSGRIEYGRE